MMYRRLGTMSRRLSIFLAVLALLHLQPLLTQFTFVPVLGEVR